MASEYPPSDSGLGPNIKVPAPAKSHPGPPLDRVAFDCGRWVNASRLSLPLNDPGVTQGVTAVERIRIYGQKLFCPDDHFDRWERSTRFIGIANLPDRGSLRDLLQELIRRNQTWVEQIPHGGALIMATPGRDGTPTLVADLYPISSEIVNARLHEGSDLIVTDIQQPPAATWPRDIKVRSRLHYYLADRQASGVSPDAIGLLVDADGSLTESGIANVLVVQDGTLTSPLPEQILPGVSLKFVRQLAAKLSIGWQERRIFVEDLNAAEEILLTGTSCGLWFARSANGRQLTANGPRFRQLRNAFDDALSD